MAVRYLSEKVAGGHSPPPGLRTLLLSGHRRIERSGTDLLFLSLTPVESVVSPEAV